MNDDTMDLLRRLVIAVEQIAEECDGIRGNISEVAEYVHDVSTELDKFRTKGITVFNDCM